ncbi:MAG: translational GTPase TypA [Pseudomonadota bacterium]
MGHQDIRNVAIVAHVDHGKTTLVDQLLRQCGQFGRGELMGECILDSNPLERERGITILAKNCAIRYTDRHGDLYHINIVDTPGHADFSGEVERVLKMADGVLLLVDAYEGVMPQTRYVLSKALAKGLTPVVVINKMDRPEIRADEVISEVFDLLVDLGADDHALDFPVVYASSKQGWATMDAGTLPMDGKGDIHAVFDAIIAHVPVADLDEDGPLRAQVTTLDYNDYVGRIGIGRVFAGTLEVGKDLALISRDGMISTQRIGQLYQFDGLGRKEVKRITTGDLFAAVGLEGVDIGVTLADINHPVQMPTVAIDEPTLHMAFRANDGPFSGRDGNLVTSRQLRNRLHHELQSNVAMRMEERGDEFVVSGRGLLHLGILLENMRREGYEVLVARPKVIWLKDETGGRTEPLEHLTVDLPTESVGIAMELVGDRRAEMIKMEARAARTHLEFEVPARGLIGLNSRMLTATQGQAVMHHRFLRYGPDRGPIGGRINGVMIATETGTVRAYALDQLHDRGVMFVKPTDAVYMGQVVGEHTRTNDIPVNVVRQKKLTNIRSSTKDATVVLKTPRPITLEGALEYIQDDELLEITPKSIRIRKRHLVESDRRRESKREASAAESS